MLRQVWEEGLLSLGELGRATFPNTVGRRAVLCKTPFPEIDLQFKTFCSPFVLRSNAHSQSYFLSQEEDLQTLRDLAGFARDADSMLGLTCLSAGTRQVSGLSESGGIRSHEASSFTLLLGAESTDGMGRSCTEEGQACCKLRPGSACS